MGEPEIFWKKNTYQSRTEDYVKRQHSSIWWRMYLGIISLTFTRFFANKRTFKQLFGTELTVNTHMHTRLYTHVCPCIRVCTYTHTQIKEDREINSTVLGWGREGEALSSAPAPHSGKEGGLRRQFADGKQ